MVLKISADKVLTFSAQCELEANLYDVIALLYINEHPFVFLKKTENQGVAWRAFILTVVCGCVMVRRLILYSI